MTTKSVFIIVAVLLSRDIAAAATIAECQEMLRQGKYAECLTAATEAIERRSYGEEWPVLKAAAETRVGKYREAAETIDAGLKRYSWSIRLRMLRHTNCQILGDQETAARLLNEINDLATSAPWRYTDADDLVALGQAATILGADPKDVLEGFYDRARRNYSSRPDGFVAAGALAFSKGDAALAADILRPALEKFSDNPDVTFLLSEALQSGVPTESATLLQKTLEINPRYAKALQRVAENQIDAEDYATAEKTIAEIHRTNPHDPEGHALLAVIHHLHHRQDDESNSRKAALSFSVKNPAIDHLIGERLSRKYRFAEGAAYQRRALTVDSTFLPAKTQLAQDLLRLGQDNDGWKLASEAQQQDKYDTTLFNLMQLKDTLQEYSTIETERFVIRMDRAESNIYGSQVTALLNEAFDALSKKYDYTPPEPVVVEIFNRPDDFAVRTFGIPDVAGFLGVCFGKVITANSPASQRDNPNNWNSVLWHEFCHVITLQMTGNRIPRWLSEGISVYEERLRDNRWGQHMTPEFRQRVLSGKITPVSEVSSAFLDAKSGADLNFAYYESSMIVEFIVQEHGFDALKQILTSLKDGLTINDALDRHTNGIEELNTAFTKYLTSVAANFAKGVEFNVPQQPGEEPQETPAPSAQNYSQGLVAAVQLIKQGDLPAAENKLKTLIELYPEDSSPTGARRILATVYERQEKTDKQIALLTEHLQHSGDDLTSSMDLLALQVKTKDWPAAAKTGELVMAIDPMQPTAIRQLLTTARALDDDDVARGMLNALLELEPADIARTHFELAQLIQQTDPTTARKHVLLSLEQAPRFREAHRLLLELMP